MGTNLYEALSIVANDRQANEDRGQVGNEALKFNIENPTNYATKSLVAAPLRAATLPLSIASAANNLFGADDLLGLNDNEAFQNAKKVSETLIAKNAGLHETGNVNEGNFLDELPTAAVTGLAGIAAGPVRKTFTKSVNKFVEKETLSKRIGREVAEEFDAAIPQIGLNNYQDGAIDKDGNVKMQLGMESFTDLFGALTGEAMIGAVPAVASSHVIRQYKRHKVKKTQTEALKSSDSSVLRMSPTNLASINKAGGHGNIDFVEVSDINEAFDSNTPGAFKDEDGTFVIQNEQVGKLYGQIDDEGNLILDHKFSEPTDFIKYSANDGKPIMDVAAAEELELQSMLKGNKTYNDPEMNMSEFDTLVVDNDGNIKVDENLKAKYAEKLGSEEAAQVAIDDMLSNNKLVKALQEVKLKAFSDAFSGGSKTSVTPLARVFGASNFDSKLATDLRLAMGDDAASKLIGAVAALRDSGITLSDKLMGMSINKTKGKSAAAADYNNLLAALFNQVTDNTAKGKKTRFTTVKKDVANMLDAAYAMEVLKSIKDDGTIDKTKMSGKSIVNTLFSDKMIDMKMPGNLEAVKNRLAGQIDKALADTNLGDKKQIEIDSTTGRPAESFTAKEDFVEAAKILGETQEDRINAMSDSFQQFTRNWAKGVTSDPTKVSVQDPYGIGIDNPSKLDEAKKEAATPFKFIPEARDMLKAIITGEGFNTGNPKLDKFLNSNKIPHNLKLAIVSGAVNKIPVKNPTLRKLVEAYMKLPRHNRIAIDKAAESMLQEAKDLLNIMNTVGNDSVYFSTRIDNNMRVGFTALTNPKSSKLAMTLLRNNDTTHTIIKPDGSVDVDVVNKYKRGALQNFGLHPERLSDAQVYVEFDKLVKDLQNLDMKLLDEGIISIASIKDVLDFAKNLKARNKDFKARLLTEADGISNGPANLRAGLGIVSERFGIGKRYKYDPAKEEYTMFAKAFSGITGVNFSRADVKPINFADFYMADYHTSAAALAQNVLEKLQLSSYNKVAVQEMFEELAPFLSKRYESVKKTTNTMKQLESVKRDINVYNAIVDNIEAIQSGEINVNNFKDIGGLQNLKRSKFENIVNEINKAKADERNIFNKSNIDFMHAVENILEGKKLSDGQKNAFINLYTESTVLDVERAFKEIAKNSPEHAEIMKFRDIYNKVTNYLNFQQAQIMNASDFIANRAEVEPILKDMLEASRPDVDNTAALVNLVQRVDAMLKTKGGASMVEVLELMGKNGYLSPSVMRASSIRQKLIPFNAMAGNVPFRRFKGYAGYDATTRTNFGSITVEGVFLPIHNIASDAAAMNHMNMNADAPFLNKFDAVATNPVDGEAIAKLGNEFENTILKDYNLPEDLQVTLDLADAMASSVKRNRESAAMFIAQQRLMDTQGTVNPDKLKKVYQDVLEEMEDVIDNGHRDIRDILDEYAKEVSERKANITELETNQYTLGSDTSAATNKAVDVKRAELKPTPNRVHKDYSWLDLVEPKDAPIGIILDRMSREGLTVATKAVNSVEFNADIKAAASMSKYGDLRIRASLEDAANDINILETMYHETAHHVINSSGHNFIELQHVMNGIFTDKAFNVYKNDGTLIGNAIKDGASFDEPLVKVLGILKQNEVIINQPGTIMNRFGIKKDIKSHLRYFEVDGYKLYTTSDLERLLMSQELDAPKKEILKQQLRQLEVDTSGALNASVAIREALDNDLTKNAGNIENDFISTIHGEGLYKKFYSSDAFQKAASLIDEFPASTLFEVTHSREALEKILGLQQGLIGELNRSAAARVEAMYELFANSNVSGIDGIVSRLAYVGGTVTAEEIARASSFENFKMILRNKVKSLEAAFKDDMEIAGVSEKELNKIIKDLSEGNINPLKTNKNKVADDMLRRIYGRDNKLIIQQRRNMIELIEKKAAYYKMFEGDMTSYVKDAFRKFNTSPKAKSTALIAFALNDRVKNADDLFGLNVEINPSANGKKFVASTTRKEGVEHIATQKMPNGEVRYIYELDSSTYNPWAQDAQIIDPTIMGFEKGVFEDGDLVLNAQAVRKSTPSVNTDFTQVYKRNVYMAEKKEHAFIAFNKQYSILKNEGFLLSAQEVAELRSKNQRLADKYVELPADHPVSKLHGRQYYNKNYTHYFEGTEGMKLGEAISKIPGINKGMEKFLTATVKAALGSVQIGKQLLLQTRLSSYINSFSSSMLITTMNADDPLKAVAKVPKAHKLINSYRELYKDLAAAELKLAKANNENKAKTELKINAIRNRIKAHKLHNAFQHGIASTIRTDAAIAHTYGQPEILKSIEKTFGKHIAEMMGVVTLDPKYGKVADAIGNIYDATEMVPKVALYLADLESKQIPKGMKVEDYAVQKVLMSHATYNNLSPVLNVVDSFSPYTKYLTNFPKMFTYTAVTKGHRLAPFVAASVILPPMTWNDEDLESKYNQKLAENGFLKVPLLDKAWYYKSANPYINPIAPFSEGVIDGYFNYDFLFTAWPNIVDINPLTNIK